MSVSAERCTGRNRAARALALVNLLLVGVNLELGRRRIELAEATQALRVRIAEVERGVSGPDGIVPAVHRRDRSPEPPRYAAAPQLSSGVGSAWLASASTGQHMTATRSDIRMAPVAAAVAELPLEADIRVAPVPGDSVEPQLISGDRSLRPTAASRGQLMAATCSDTRLAPDEAAPDEAASEHSCGTFAGLGAEGGRV